MALGRIHHIDFRVEDLEKTVDYFTKKLGFKVVRRTEHAGGSVELVSPAGGEIFEFRKVTEEYLSRPGVINRAYFNHICFEVQDIDKEYEELKSNGVYFEEDGPTPIFEGPADTPHLQPATGRKLVTTFDAEGHRCIQLVEVKPT